jgi:hypothetical protein
MQRRSRSSPLRLFDSHFALWHSARCAGCMHQLCASRRVHTKYNGVVFRIRVGVRISLSYSRTLSRVRRHAAVVSDVFVVSSASRTLLLLLVVVVVCTIDRLHVILSFLFLFVRLPSSSSCEVSLSF